MSDLNKRQNFSTRLAQVPTDQFKNVFDSAPVPLVEGVWSKTFEVLNVNPAALELFGASDKQEFASGFNFILGKMPSKILLELLSARVRGEVFETELRLPTLKRAVIYVFMRLAYVPDSAAGPQHSVLSFHDITTYKRQETLLKRLSQMDWLTQILNQRAILERIDQEWERAQRYKLDLTCILFDLDNFKSVNDTFGHLWGDRVLKNASAQLKKSLRKTDIVGRYGGDEFVVLLPETPAANAVIPVERFLKSYEEFSEVKAQNLTIRTTFSVGISGFPCLGIESGKGLLAAADEALYVAKTAGGNRYQLYQKMLPA